MSNGNEAVPVPGGGKLPIRPMLPEQVEPKVQKNFIWMWEELSRYLNKTLASIPWQNNNVATNPVGGGLNYEDIPIGTNFNNFLDANYWGIIGDQIGYNLNRSDGNLVVSANFVENNNNYYLTRFVVTNAIYFRPRIRPDANGYIEVKIGLTVTNKGNWNNFVAQNYSTAGLLLFGPDLTFVGGYSWFGTDSNNLTRYGQLYKQTDAAQSGGAKLLTLADQNNYPELLTNAQFRFYMYGPDNNNYQTANANQHIPYYEYWIPKNNNWERIYAFPGMRGAMLERDGLRVGLGGQGFFFPPGGFAARINSFEVVAGRIAYE